MTHTHITHTHTHTHIHTHTYRPAKSIPPLRDIMRARPSTGVRQPAPPLHHPARADTAQLGPPAHRRHVLQHAQASDLQLREGAQGEIAPLDH